MDNNQKHPDDKVAPSAVEDAKKTTNTTHTMQSFAIGNQCIVHGLQSTAGQTLNGQQVTIVANLFEKKRFCCRFKDGSVKNVKPINLKHSSVHVPLTAVPTPTNDEDDCPICLESLPNDSTKFTRMTCCGKGMHKWCVADLLATKSLSLAQKSTCLMCRQEYCGSMKKAFDEISIWVVKGKAWAQTLLAQKYFTGEGVKQSKTKAAELYELASKQGNTTAQYNLGVMYHDGNGVPQSYKKAKVYFESAANKDSPSAQYNLGDMIINSRIFPFPSIPLARIWWVKSAAQGFAPAIKELQELDKFEKRKTPSFLVNPTNCSFCWKPHNPPTHAIKPCTQCRTVYYCNRKCQTQHWKSEHKKKCKHHQLNYK